jgi:hypothetical protein
MRTAPGMLLVASAFLLAGCTDHLTGTLTVLPPPASVGSISLNGAIHLDWSDDSYLADPSTFDHYRVYSTSYNLDLNSCGSSWSVEGTTVAPTFLVGALTNGVPRCFAISAIAIDGSESLWSPYHYDTPRPDAKSIVVFTTAGNASANGFRFWFDANGNSTVDAGELGLVGASSTSSDFTVQVNGANLEIAPVFTGTKVQSFGIVNDLTDIDIAPATGYASTPVTALVRTGYVFQIDVGDGFFRYGAIKVSAVGSNYIIFDWSYQTDPGNPELIRVGRIAGMP